MSEATVQLPFPRSAGERRAKTQDRLVLELAQVPSDNVESEDQGRQTNEAAADMRAYIVSGPFITGS